MERQVDYEELMDAVFRESHIPEKERKKIQKSRKKGARKSKRETYQNIKGGFTEYRDEIDEMYKVKDMLGRAEKLEIDGKYIEAGNELLRAAEYVSKVAPRAAAKYATSAKKEFQQGFENSKGRYEENHRAVYHDQMDKAERGVEEAGKLAKALRHEAARRKVKGIESHFENYFNAILFIAVGLVGLFFLSPNVTGNVIGAMTTNTANLTGAILFFIGLIGLFFTFRRK